MPLPRALACALLTGLAAAQTWIAPATAVPTTAVAWDATRHRLLLAGADTGQRIYEWDGSVARERLDELLGQKTVQHLVHDAATSRMLALSTDRWVGAWNGGAWSWQRGGTAPPGDTVTSVALDAGRRRLVVVSGLGQVHEWDGQQWWAIGNATPAGIEAGAPFAWDPVSGHCLLYGGVTAASADTWAWNGFAWLRLPTGGSPGPRAGAALALDPGSGRLLLYGGDATATDTWQWSGSDWLRLPTSGDPGPQVGARLVADDLGVLLLATAGARQGDLFALRQGVWRQLGNLPARPASRQQTAWAHDRVRGTLVGFGGHGNAGVVPPDQTMLFDRGWLPCRPATNPPLRHSAHLAWSSVEQEVLLFGGLYRGSTLRGDTWSWNGSDWRNRQPAHAPPARLGAVMTEDPGGGVLLFGGTDNSSWFGDTWRWNGVDWQQLAPATAPAPRAFTAFASDPGRGQVVMAGGYSLSGLYGGETWVWDGTTWTRQAAILPVSSYVAAAFRPRSQRIVAMGPGAAFEWTGSDWVAVPGPGHPGGSFPRLVTHHGRRQLWSLDPSPLLLVEQVAAHATAYGAGCAIGPTPALAALGVPRPDTPFELELTARTGSMPCLVVLGFAAQNEPIGNGCRSLVALPGAVWFALVDAGGFVRVPLPIPNRSALHGLQVTAQGAVWNPAASLLGSLTLTAGLRITVGE